MITIFGEEIVDYFAFLCLAACTMKYHSLFTFSLPDFIAQLVVCLTVDPGVASSNPSSAT